MSDEFLQLLEIFKIYMQKPLPAGPEGIDEFEILELEETFKNFICTTVGDRLKYE